MDKLTKECKRHGVLTRDECYAYKCFRNTKEGRKDYIGYRCRICWQDGKRAWQQRNPDQYKSALKDWDKRNLKKRCEYVKKTAKKYPEKIKARNAVNNGRRIGVVIQQPCMICKNSVSQAHHHDYTKPLDVVWLCHDCHVIEHIKLKEENHATTH